MNCGAERLFPGSAGSDGLVSRYEELRGQALGKVSVAGRGFVFFLRRGMAAWMDIRAECVPAPGADEKSGGGIHVPAGLRSEAVMILAGMALSAAIDRQRAAGML